MPDIKALQRKKRGQIVPNELDIFDEFSDSELIKDLTSKDTITRTCVATVIGNRKLQPAIPALCEALKTEKALYTKIAISEALGKIGEPALPFLIKLLGKIGNNQYKNLPDKPFEKWDYPLPRDIVARTINKVGRVAINQLINSLEELVELQLSEAIDVLGYISFYSRDITAAKVLLRLLDAHSHNHLLVWKIIRSLQSFSGPEVVEVLEKQLLNHPAPAIRWEAARSLAQISKEAVPYCFDLAETDADCSVQYAVKLARERILTKLHAG